MLAASAVHREFEPQLDQTKDYKISIFYFSAKYTIKEYEQRLDG